MVMAFFGEGSDEKDEGNAVSEDDDERGCSEGRERDAHGRNRGERAFGCIYTTMTKSGFRKLQRLRGSAPAERGTNAL